MNRRKAGDAIAGVLLGAALMSLAWPWLFSPRSMPGECRPGPIAPAIPAKAIMAGWQGDGVDHYEIIDQNQIVHKIGAKQSEDWWCSVK